MCESDIGRWQRWRACCLLVELSRRLGSGQDTWAARVAGVARVRHVRAKSEWVWWSGGRRRSGVADKMWARWLQQGVMELKRFFVVKSLRQHGVGSALFRHALDEVLLHGQRACSALTWLMLLERALSGAPPHASLPFVGAQSGQEAGGTAHLPPDVTSVRASPALLPTPGLYTCQKQQDLMGGGFSGAPPCLRSGGHLVARHVAPFLDNGGRG